MSYCHLSIEERYVIFHLVLYGLNLRQIGRRLQRHHATISREIKRNRPTYADDAVYCYDAAQQFADHRKGKAHHWRRESNPQLVDYVQCKLIDDWSPEKIAGRLIVDYPNNELMRVSRYPAFVKIYEWWVKPKRFYDFYWRICTGRCPFYPPNRRELKACPTLLFHFTS
jgi:IS30 family transposase